MALAERTATSPRARAQKDGWPMRLGEHWLIAVLVAAGATIRLLAMLAYTPALFFPDSWGYIGAGLTGAFVGLPSLHPVGYSLLIRLLTLPDRSLVQLIAVQHLAVIGVGIAIYLTLIRARLPHWAAAAAAAPVLLDGYTVTLEQYVMSDTFFTVLLFSAALIVAWPRLAAAEAAPARFGLRRALLAGLVLAAAALDREAMPFVFPIFFVYLIWVRVGWRAVVAFTLAAALPLIAYSAMIDARYHVFGMTATSGLTLYGRVAGFASCQGVRLAVPERALCETAAQRASHPDAPDWYIWGPSPASRIFHPDTESIAQVATANRVLESFAKTMILAHPLAFANVTLTDFVHYLTPGATPYGNSVSATSLPRSARREARDRAVQRADLPGLRIRVRPPAGLVRTYRRLVHVPRLLLGLLALATIAALLARVPARREIFLFGGGALLLLLGTAATGGFGIRYLLPAVPLLAIGGTLALAGLLSRRRSAGAIA
jgi:hypothetical protein